MLIVKVDERGRQVWNAICRIRCRCNNLCPWMDVVEPSPSAICRFERLTQHVRRLQSHLIAVYGVEYY